jgi:hypothetical protein
MSFPVKVNQNVSDKYKSILEKEGERMVIGGSYSGVIGAGAVSLANSPSLIRSQMIVDFSYEVWIDRFCKYSIGALFDGVVSDSDPSFQQFGAIPNVNVKFNIPKLGQSISLGSFFEGDGGTYNAGLCGYGTKITNDLNFNADKVIWWIGDSISQPTVNNDVYCDMMTHFMVRNWLNENSKLTHRLSIRANGGRTTRTYETLRKNGQMIIDQADFIFYQLGMNDKGSQGNEHVVPVAEYKQNIKNFIKHKQRLYKSAYMFCLGNTPIQFDYDNSLSAEYRTAMQEAVSESNDPRVIYISLEKSFNRTLTSNYATTDNTSTKCVHPGSIAAQLSIFNCIVNGQNFDGSTQTGLQQLVNNGTIKI